jgi:predicted enzyme related to lactoylglutathione lyase
MPHPVIHAEIRSGDPDTTRAFFGELFGWTYPAEGGFPGYTFADVGVAGALPTAIGPLQGGEEAVLFFVGVQDVAATLSRAEELGGRIVQPATDVPGVTFGVFADTQGHRVGVAATS